MMVTEGWHEDETWSYLLWNPGPAQGLQHSSQSRRSKLCPGEGKATEGLIKEKIELAVEVKEFSRLTTGRDGIGIRKPRKRI